MQDLLNSIHEISLPDGTCVRLRPLTLQDASLLAPQVAAMEPWQTLGISASRLQRHWQRPPLAGQHWGIWLPDGACAGVFSVRMGWLYGAYVELLAILPAFQGRGIGRCLLQWLERLPLAEHKNIWLCASEFNLPARRFYERLGFQAVGRLPGLIHPQHAEILYRKPLA